jgi:hypothetical protein
VRRWFEDNPLGVVLASVAGFLVLVVLLLGVLWSRPPSGDPAAGAAEDGALQIDIAQLEASEPLERYAVITERPLFNTDRQPFVATAAEEGEEEGEELAEEEVEAPSFQLAGVVITPSIRMATLRQEGEADSLVAFVDQPLEGNYGTWRISNIEPRKVTLSSARGEQIELELEIHDTAMAAPEKPVEEAASEEADLEPGETQRDSDRPLTRAEEIRQRIAERREELRRAAEEAEAQQADREDRREEARAQDDSESKPLDYRQTIQAMIRGDKPAARENDK